MTIRGFDLRHTVVSSENFTIPTSNSFESYPTRFPVESYSDSSIEALYKILKRLAGMDLPGKEHVEAYLRHLVVVNRRPGTLYSINGFHCSVPWNDTGQRQKVLLKISRKET